jgi:hypothetical protein
VPVDGVCTARSPRLHLAQTSGRDLPDTELGRCNRHLDQDRPALPWLSCADGSQAQSLAYSATVILFFWGPR